MNIFIPIILLSVFLINQHLMDVSNNGRDIYKVYFENNNIGRIESENKGISNGLWTFTNGRMYHLTWYMNYIIIFVLVFLLIYKDLKR